MFEDLNVVIAGAAGEGVQTVGKVVGNNDLEAEGKVENLGGKVQENLGKVVRYVEKKGNQY